MTTFTATYSPDDNKLRITASERLEPELYNEMKAARYRWAPKQQLFFAVWNPRAEDIALRLAGEITDEDTSLLERAEERAERFDNYSDKRAAEAMQQRESVESIAGSIPMGQPIMIGHHSARKARRDAERIESGIKRACQLWETSEYWQRRAAGALAHAKYKELPAVRARRIKKIEAALRKDLKQIKEYQTTLALWNSKNLTREKAEIIAGFHGCGFNLPEKNRAGYYYSAYDVLNTGEYKDENAPKYTLEQLTERANVVFNKAIKACQRWVTHYENRLVYEKAMLEEQGASKLIEKKARPKQLPICNYRARYGVTVAHRWRKGEFEDLPQLELTKEQYSAIDSDLRGTREVENSHRVKIAIVSFDDEGKIRRWAGHTAKTYAVFLTDSKVHAKPEPMEPTPSTPAPEQESVYVEPKKREGGEAFEQLKNVKVETATAPELFVTPEELAKQVIETADIQPGHYVLEPSAGTGNLLKALPCIRPKGAVTACELNAGLCKAVEPWADEIHHGDFLERTVEELGTFDRIVMNPPFSNKADIDHVNHALNFLKSDGRLVAIMSSGTLHRSDKKTVAFREMVEVRGGVIEELPADSFKTSGTSVNTVMVTIEGVTQ